MRDCRRVVVGLGLEARELAAIKDQEGGQSRRGSSGDMVSRFFSPPYRQGWLAGRHGQLLAGPDFRSSVIDGSAPQFSTKKRARLVARLVRHAAPCSRFGSIQENSGFFSFDREATAGLLRIAATGIVVEWCW